MISTLFIFFAGIALSLGFVEIWQAISRKKFGTNFLFGAFTLAAGCNYLALGMEYTFSPLSIFFAVCMFALFPWYYALELGYIRKKTLWVITGLSIGYYVVFLTDLGSSIKNIEYLFSYSVYVLTAVYCFMGLANMKYKASFVFYPFLIVTLYYTIFIMEEMSFNYYGMQLPWRRQLNFNYLDLFPMIIILNKLVLIIRYQWSKGALERSLEYYRENLNIVLEKADQLVVALDKDGKIIYGNKALQELLKTDRSINKLPFADFLQEKEIEPFRSMVLEGGTQKGLLATQHHSKDGPRTIAWSFTRRTDTGNSESDVHAYLFGTDITRLKRTEEDLRAAYDDLEKLKNKLQAENIQLRKNSAVERKDDKLIGQSPLFHYVLNRIEDAAPLDIPVLLEGETGVGKELFANAIHENSPRRHLPYLKVNCAAIPGELLESELFGYKKGAFTGAEKDKKGIFELADGGTLFLDEIGELPISLQPKLLRAIQEQKIKPLGAEKEIPINIRLLAATNRNLLNEVEKGNFRSDLYYRINVFPITIPPLRKRKEDIPLFVEWFVNYFNEKYAKEIAEVSESLMEVLQAYSWPGNIRQLRNIIERAVITSSESVLKLAAPLPEESNLQDHSLGLAPINGGTEEETISLEEFERRFITQTLERCNWKISGKSSASELLDLPPSTLRSKMKKLGIQPG
ncbi:MAG: sigma 54-interacting transcriptional regulator [Flavobacteriaceae bacterium]